MSDDCLHCEIHNVLESHLQNEQADLGGNHGKGYGSAGRLDPDGSPADQLMLMADIVANLGGMVVEKNQEPDPTNPRRSSH
jgi:hypothetical protein